MVAIILLGLFCLASGFMLGKLHERDTAAGLFDRSIAADPPATARAIRRSRRKCRADLSVVLRGDRVYTPRLSS